MRILRKGRPHRVAFLTVEPFMKKRDFPDMACTVRFIAAKNVKKNVCGRMESV